MIKTDKKRRNINTIACTVVAVVMLFASILVMVNHIYKTANDEAYEKLHMETLQIKQDINLQMRSDQENLETMARFAARLHSNGEDYSLLFDSFHEIGLFENIKMLLPNNVLITKEGSEYIGDKISFVDEAKKGEYISGRVEDLTIEGREVVRSVTPVLAEDGTTVAMLYGVIDLDTLKGRYLETLESLGADLFVVEAGTGDFLIDTKHPEPGNISDISTTEFNEGYSYNKILNDLTNSKNGFSSFKSIYGPEYLYAHYSPLNFSDWQIMLMKPEDKVFESAKRITKYLLVISTIITFIMLLYVIYVFLSQRNANAININASKIRKSLLEVNQDKNGINTALEAIAAFSKSRSSFFIDTYGEEYKYISPEGKKKALKGEERAFFVAKLLAYVSRIRKDRGAGVYVKTIKVDKDLELMMPELYTVLKNSKADSVSVAAVVTNNSNTSILGVVNARRRGVKDLLKEIAVCFAMSVYNKNHLQKTEEMAFTDALTGVANRMAYKRDIKDLDIKNLTCIYIDVNELNYYNNTHGHVAGDQMLLFIAEMLKEEFYDGRLYRMGGDEFLIFSEGIEHEKVMHRLERANRHIEEMKYHISIGVKEYYNECDIEELVNNAEKLMYIEKAKYYQNKSSKNDNLEKIAGSEVIDTGIKAVDSYLSIISQRYVGVYGVSLEKDVAVQLIAPANYFNLSDNEDVFSDVMRNYIHEMVKPEYQRQLLAFLEYDVIKQQLSEGAMPIVTYTKIDGTRITLSIYGISEATSEDLNTIWIFEKEV